MDISIKNIKNISKYAFEDMIYDKNDQLKSLEKFFTTENNPLGQMIYDEFNFYWNDLFSKQLLEHSFSMPFPRFVKPSLGVWLLNWQDYIEKKYPNDFFSPSMTVREMNLQDFQDEVDKVIEFFKVSQQKLSQTEFQSIEQGLNLRIPHYYTSKSGNKEAFKQGFVSCVFYLAKIKFSNENFVQEEDLKKFFQSYFSYFYKESKTIRDTVFNTSCFPNTDYKKVMEEKLNFIKPKNPQEQYLFYHLDVPSSSFANALNEVVGLKEYGNKNKEHYAIEQLQTFFTSIKMTVLEDKFKLRHNIKTKKIKI